MKNNIPVYDLTTISEFRQEDLLVSKFAPYALIHNELHLPHRHTFYHMVLFTEGTGSHSIDFRNFEVKPFQVYFMVPGQVHSWKFDGPVDGYVVNFSVSFFHSFLLKQDYITSFSFFKGRLEDSVLDVPEGSRSTVTSCFEEILREGNGNLAYSADLVRTLLLKIFITLERLTTGSPDKPQSTYTYTILNTYRNLVDENYKKLRLPKEYAALLYITPNHLNSICKDIWGISAGQVIRDRIILEAKRLLINLSLSVSEIAFQLNFNDNSYFSKFFKKQVGETPEEFRRTALKNT